VLQAIRAGIDDGQPIHVILDNLNHHKNRGVREWCAANGVELVCWAHNFDAAFVEDAFELGRDVALVGEDRLAGPAGSKLGSWSN